ncbi:phage portal protein [Chitinophaga japonensis]|uniref:SPP1 family phage portal protein n=1 Tax=Chitinophaga japonensis TaxID=104662 RepID=A0A562SY81_CHIJA|nr:phage portal protein [Chitinophaga japonensis]TWI86307.1 SPP1 family phage portal protein [Chitinophaga japonensis]
MEVVELEALVGNYAQLVDTVKKQKPAGAVAQEDIKKQLDPKQHAVTDQTKRLNKTKQTKDAAGNPVTGTVEVSRIPIPLQKKIVKLAAAFLTANPIKLSSQPVDQTQIDLMKVLDKTWDANKLFYKTMTLAQLMMGETECAELWYTQQLQPNENYWMGTANEGKASFKLRMRILANSLGDTLYPVFDAAGDMIAFGRGYFVTVGDKQVEHFDLYTPTQIYKGEKAGDAWVTTPEPNVVGKIPIIYYKQPLPEWYDVQEMIERLETVISNNADTNDYFGSPIVFVEGEVAGFADKGESGKVLVGKSGGKAYYLTWDNAPEAIKLEIDTLKYFIHSMTDTPDISFETMKGLGTYSGIALKMLFLGAHLKAAEKEGIFGEGIQRRINYLLAALGKINITFDPVANMTVTPIFEYYLPKNEQEIIDLLIDAAGPGTSIMSQKTAIRQNPLVEDPEAEMTLMEEEGKLGSDIQTA